MLIGVKPQCCCGEPTITTPCCDAIPATISCFFEILATASGFGDCSGFSNKTLTLPYQGSNSWSGSMSDPDNSGFTLAASFNCQVPPGGSGGLTGDLSYGSAGTYKGTPVIIPGSPFCGATQSATRSCSPFAVVITVTATGACYWQFSASCRVTQYRFTFS